ncbi:hypothetical protein CHS0354_021815 [Potamilus streckersoni]|uniref:Uncharacterized protein n=1 Tax=Potamilus streckersoni TaxID=2493646 RepID=A0AAE0S4C0_9BIVA|nr:hypothetical protein CHS0354_021815 [Potamilus streckersoni]
MGLFIVSYRTLAASRVIIIVFNNVDLFELVVGEITDFTRGRRKSLNNVMKTLSYLQLVKVY